MRIIALTLTALLAGALTASALSPRHHAVEVGHFTELNVRHSINVDYRANPDSAGLAVFEADDDMVNAVMFRNNGKGKLQIEIDVDKDNDRPLPTVTVYSRYLTKIENQGDSTVRAFDVNAGPRFSATLIGNGRLSVRDIATDEVSAKQLTGRGQLALSGTCRKASLSCTGVGAIQADNLEARDVAVTVVGPVAVGCYVTGTLSVKGMGPGKVYYAGSPAKVVNRSAGPTLTPLD